MNGIIFMWWLTFIQKRDEKTGSPNSLVPITTGQEKVWFETEYVFWETFLLKEENIVCSRKSIILHGDIF